MKAKVTIKFEEFYKRIKTETPFNTQDKLGKALGISRSAVSWMKNHQSELKTIPEDWVTRLEKHGYSREWLLNGTGSKFRTNTGLYVSSDYLRVRTINPDLTTLHTHEYYSFSSPWLEKKGTSENLVMVPVDSDDMAPELNKGDVVMVDMRIKEPKVGRMFVLVINNQFHFRKVRLSNAGFELVDARSPDGISFPKPEDDTVIKVLGQIVWLSKEFS